MRSSLTRSALAVAALAIGSAVLTAAPASAAGSADVTRAEILDAIGTTFAFAEPSDADLLLVQKVCGDAVPSDGYFRMTPNQTDEGVEGVLVQAQVPGQDEAPSTFCTFAAFAPRAAAATMAGTATISSYDDVAGPDSPYALTGDAYVTKPITDPDFFFGAQVTASGDVVKTEAATTTRTRVSKPKSTQQKKAAYRTYQRSVRKAKASYKKTLAKAGSSTSKKKAARATYTTRKKAARATLHIAWSSDKKTVVTVTPRTSRASFTFSARSFSCGRANARC